MNRLVDTGRKSGVEISIDTSQVRRVSRRIKVDNRELKEFNHFKYLESVSSERWLLYKGNQDEKCHCQRIISEKKLPSS